MISGLVWGIEVQGSIPDGVKPNTWSYIVYSKIKV